jgi:hypothetical protein
LTKKERLTTLTQKLDSYLKCYADKHRVARAEDGVGQIQTSHRPRDGLTFDVYVYSDTHLAVMLPPRFARRLLQRPPEAFTIHQDASDAMVLLFPTERLEELADDLKLRRRRKLSEEHKQKLVTATMPYRFRPASEGKKVA